MKLKRSEIQSKVKNRSSIYLVALSEWPIFVNKTTILDLTRDMSKLQAELNSIKTKENEAQDQIVYLTKQLETERRNESSMTTDALKLKVKVSACKSKNEV